MTQEGMFGENGLIKTLTAKIINRALQAEMDHHLGYGKSSSEDDNSGNSRNGFTGKRAVTGDNDVPGIRVPRDRESTFEPAIVPKRQKRLPLFNDQIVSMYAFGMSQRDIRAHLKEICGADMSAELISKMAGGVMEEVREWQQRPLGKTYPILYLDALRANSRQDGKTAGKAAFVALGINMDGRKEVLGLWISENEGARFWANVLNELRNRGVRDILIACMDGLTGFPDAVRTVFPDTHIQRCIVHMAGSSTRYAPLQGSEGGLPRSEGDMLGSERADGPRKPGCLCCEMGCQVPGHFKAVEGGMGRPEGILPVSAGDQEGHLHDQCDRIPELSASEGHEVEIVIPDG